MLMEERSMLAINRPLVDGIIDCWMRDLKGRNIPGWPAMTTESQKRVQGGAERKEPGRKSA